MADRAAALSKRFPIESSNAFVEALADCFTCCQSKQRARCIIQVSDTSFRVSDDDALLNGIEYCLQKTFLLRQTQKIVLHLFRPDTSEPLDKFFNKTGFHDACQSCSAAKEKVPPVQPFTGSTLQ